jgi:hypothetical protein
MKNAVKGWLRAHRVEIAIAIVFGLIGFVIGLGTRFDLKLNARFDDDINAVQLLTLICTIILALAVSAILEKQKHADKTVKDVLLKRIEEIYSFAQETALKANKEFLYTDAASAAKRLSVSITRVFSLLKGNNIAFREQLRDEPLIHVEKILDLMTDTPIHDADDSSKRAVKVKDSKLAFSAERASEIDNAFEDLKQSLMMIELHIIQA